MPSVTLGRSSKELSGLNSLEIGVTPEFKVHELWTRVHERLNPQSGIGRPWTSLNVNDRSPGWTSTVNAAGTRGFRREWTESGERVHERWTRASIFATLIVPIFSRRESWEKRATHLKNIVNAFTIFLVNANSTLLKSSSDVRKFTEILLGKNERAVFPSEVQFRRSNVQF